MASTAYKMPGDIDGNLPDFTVQDEGSIILLRPLTSEAQNWLQVHIPDNAQYFGNALVIERRYVGDIVHGILDEGLSVR